MEQVKADAALSNVRKVPATCGSGYIEDGVKSGVVYACCGV